MRAKHVRTLESVFGRPTSANIKWSDIGKMFAALGAYVEEAKGSRVCVELNDVVAVFHRPHPRKEADKGAVASVRKFLKEAGIK